MAHSAKSIRAAYLKLNKELKAFGKTKCKNHKNRTHHGKKSIMECHHSAMGYGGMSRNTYCELENCPRVLYGDEGV
jgi:hypothetical protein